MQMSTMRVDNVGSDPVYLQQGCADIQSQQQRNSMQTESRCERLPHREQGTFIVVIIVATDTAIV